MLLVTFHGGSGSSSINNVRAYETSDGKDLNKDALDVPKGVTLSELRAMVLANGTAIAHPFGIVFNGSDCFISNQDTNVVAQVTVSDGGLTGSLVQGPSPYLNGLFPSGTFLEGTYVASQVGVLHDVKVEATAVDRAEGGLGVSFDNGKVKNSVRDVAIANGILFACDEPDNTVNLYSLADGSYLGSSNILAGGPTHLAINNGGFYVSAGSTLYWGALPASASSPSLTLQAITPKPLAQGVKIGGISFGGASTVYVPYQSGTGGNNPGGAIFSYTVSQQNPPALSNEKPLVSSLKDTPEFVLYWSGGS